MKRISKLLISLSFIIAVFFVSMPLNANNSKAFANNFEEKVYDSVSYKDPFEKKIIFEVKINDDFCDSSVIVVLDSKISSYRGFLDSKTQKFLDGVGYKGIVDLSAFPQEMLNEKGLIDEKRAPELAKHFEKMPFRQILHVMLEKKDKQNVLDVINEIEKHEDVLYAGTNGIDSNATSGPNDPRITEQWGLIGSNGASVAAAWNISIGASNVRVGIIDSGIDTHYDLSVNLVQGYDFYNNSSITSNDVSGHGTHVAGIVGAAGNNGVGISGVAQRVSLVPLKTVNSAGTHYESDRILAVNYAKNLWGTSQQISILNHSIGEYGERLGLLNAIIQFPGIFVWSAGNENTNIDNIPGVNAFKFISNLIAVGATDSGGSKPSFSNYGKETVDVFAPGVGILSTFPGPGNTYASHSGTSMAAPHVTGVAALLLSYSNISAGQIKATIMNNVDYSSGLNNLCRSGGRLNAFKALQSRSGLPLIDSQFYNIQNLGSGMVFDVYRGNTGNGTGIEQHPYHGGNNQKFKAHYSGDGTYFFVPVHAQNKRLESLNMGFIIHSDSMHDGKRFYIVKLPNGAFKIIPKNASLRARDNSAGVANSNSGIRVNEVAYNGSYYQQWYFNAV